MIEVVVKADTIGFTAAKVLAVNEDGTYKIQRTDITEPSDGIALHAFWAECPPDLWEWFEQ